MARAYLSLIAFDKILFLSYLHFLYILQCKKVFHELFVLLY